MNEDESKLIHSSETGKRKRQRAKNTAQAKVAARKAVDTSVQATRIPELAMDLARNLADGDPSRIQVQSDGSIIVRNL